jgi:tetratricopeptide (TPR) repeat protein
MACDREALALHRSFGDTRGEAVSLWGIGYLHIEQGNPGEAVPNLRAAVKLFRETGDAALLRWTLRTLGFAYLRFDDLERARPAYMEALELARAAGDDELAAGSSEGSWECRERRAIWLRRPTMLARASGWSVILETF